MSNNDPDLEFGAYCRSGKMLVLKSLLALWLAQRQRVLLFSQSKQMLTILEKFLITEGYFFLNLENRNCKF